MNSKQAGFTLIELVVGMALIVLIMAGVAEVLTTLLANGTRGSDLIDRQQEARWAVDMIAQDLRYARTCQNTAGTTNSVDIERTSSTGTKMRVKYSTKDSGTGKYVLQRELWNPTVNSTTATVTSPISNINRGYVKSDDLAVTTTVSSTNKITKVEIVYRIRTSASDTNPAVAQTTIYPINGITAGTYGY